MKSRERRPQKRRSRAWANARQVLFVLLALGSTLGVAVLATDQYVAVSKRQAAAAAAAFIANSDEIYTGSILYMPNTSEICHQWLFDNRSGSLSDNGMVDCVRAAYRGLEPPKRLSVARTQVISSGFREGAAGDDGH